MEMIISFMLGFVFGGICGTVIMAICAAQRGDSDGLD